MNERAATSAPSASGTPFAPRRAWSWLRRAASVSLAPRHGGERHAAIQREVRETVGRFIEARAEVTTAYRDMDAALCRLRDSIIGMGTVNAIAPNHVPALVDAIEAIRQGAALLAQHHGATVDTIYANGLAGAAAPGARAR